MKDLYGDRCSPLTTGLVEHVCQSFTQNVSYLLPLSAKYLECQSFTPHLSVVYTDAVDNLWITCVKIFNCK